MNRLCRIEQMRLVMAGYAGFAGTGILARVHRDRLTKRLPAWLPAGAARFEADAAQLSETALRLAGPLAERTGLPAGMAAERSEFAGQEEEPLLFRIGDGGVLAALWFFAERFALGMEAELRAIPIRQETIEICEVLDVNPYQLYGAGSVLIGTRRPQALIGVLAGGGIMAADIGCIFPGHVRRIFNDGTQGYLNIPRRIEEMKEGTAKRLIYTCKAYAKEETKYSVQMDAG